MNDQTFNKKETIQRLFDFIIKLISSLHRHITKIIETENHAERMF